MLYLVLVAVVLVIGAAKGVSLIEIPSEIVYEFPRLQTGSAPIVAAMSAPSPCVKQTNNEKPE